MKKIKSKNSKIQLGQKVSMVKDNIKSGVKYIMNAYLQKFKVGHVDGESTTAAIRSKNSES